MSCKLKHVRAYLGAALARDRVHRALALLKTAELFVLQCIPPEEGFACGEIVNRNLEKCFTILTTLYFNSLLQLSQVSPLKLKQLARSPQTRQILTIFEMLGETSIG